MKKRLILLILAITMLVNGCSFMEVKEEQNTSNGESGQKKVEAKKLPSNYESWTIDDMIQYLTNEQVFENENWVQKSGAQEIQGTGLAGSVSYYSDDNKIAFEIMYIDLKATDDQSKVQIDSLKKDHCLLFDGSPYIPNHQVGAFTFRTEGTKDKKFLGKFQKCYEKLLKEYNVKADF